MTDTIVKYTIDDYKKHLPRMDDIIKNRNITISIIPTEFTRLAAKRYVDEKVSTARQYYNFIIDEIEFWDNNDPTNKLNEISKLSSLKNAKSYFENAIDNYEKGNTNSGDTSLNNSINSISNGILASKTYLAKYLIQNIGKDEKFFKGFRFGIINDRTSQKSFSNPAISEFEGINAALSFLKLQTELNLPDDILNSYEEVVQSSIGNFSKLNEDYSRTFNEQETRVQKFYNDINEKIKTMEEDSNNYFEDRNKSCEELETLYREKLKLEEPAKYWNDQGQGYIIKGLIWSIVSLLLSGVLINCIYNMLIKVMTYMNNETDWLDYFKIYAFITVIASIGIYILRIFVKMLLSSFHLARDAKERYTLSYFYLALIKESGVTDNERAIILNSLFSRADTGLLKGDSGPVMSGDIVSLLNKYDK